MRDTIRRIHLPALLVAAIALLGAVPAWAELDAECVLRLAETATDEMTLAELRAQCRLPGDDAERLAARVLKQEHRLYPQAIRWLAQGRVSLNGEQLLFDQQPLQQPLQINAVE